MQQNTEHASSSELCYLEASKVESPAGVLSELEVLTPEGELLGNIEGVVIEAAARRVRYFDVRSLGWRSKRYLLEADQLARVEPGRKALRLLVDSAAKQVQSVDATELRKFSDDDLLAALFAPRAA